MSGKWRALEEVQAVANRFRTEPESEQWEKLADKLDTIGPVSSMRELVLFQALVEALDARDGWKGAQKETQKTLGVALEQLDAALTHEKCRALLIEAAERGEQNRWGAEEIADVLLRLRCLRLR